MSNAVLVVDDEKEIREITRTFLQSHGLVVYVAANGVEGIAVFNEHRQEISVVVTDIQMPQMDGIQMIRELLQLQPSLNIVVVSNVVPRRYSLGRTVMVLNKPYSLDELLRLILSK